MVNLSCHTGGIDGHGIRNKLFVGKTLGPTKSCHPKITYVSWTVCVYANIYHSGILGLI